MTGHRTDPHDVTTAPFLAEATASLPATLATFDRNSFSSTHGVGDRFHWAWGLIDFPNGTFQGAVNGMARLWANGIWPYPTPADVFLARIDDVIGAIAACSAPDGSLAEAFPNEGSWCVTALVGFDVLCAIEVLADAAGPELTDRWMRAVEPLISNVCSTDETHAFISNHLATGAAALARWASLADCERSRRAADSLVDRIVSHQHDEGWYLEYEGADPGYQSLATYYLADIAVRTEPGALLESLERSVRFLSRCVHPDGSFGGFYGSRNTRFYIPSGFHLLAPHSPTAAAIARRLAASVATKSVVTLSALDAPNRGPVFNSYCWAATLPVAPTADEAVLPCDSGSDERIVLPGAGLVVDSGPRHYTIVSLNKGGVVQHYVDGQQSLVDCGAVYRDRRGRYGSTQAFDANPEWRLDGENLEITSGVSTVLTETPSPLQFAALRLAAISVLRSRRVREWVKRRLVSRLITRPPRWALTNVRHVRLGADLSIDDRQVGDAAATPIARPGPFTAIHMASQGYWQRQDEQQR